MLELKDKLNLLWKFLFLAVFTYGVISVTCCKKGCSSSCGNKNRGKGISSKPHVSFARLDRSSNSMG